MMKQGLTDSRPKLEEALSLVDIPTNKQLRAGGWAPGTILYDAVVQAANDTMRKQQWPQGDDPVDGRGRHG